MSKTKRNIPRNYQVYSMTLRCKSDTMRDRRQRRPKEDDVRKYVEEYNYENDWEDYEG